jgi:dTDP-4-dehydrorhamnose 3,5-epimerase
MEFTFTNGKINDIVIIRTKRMSDSRGDFIKGYEQTPFSAFIKDQFLEDYISVSNKNVLRGLHYQLEPKAQGKLITVIAGKILDVALDLREKSETFGKYSMVELSESHYDSIWIPPGFAHGFLTLQDNSIVLNRCTNNFDVHLERGVLWNDPFFHISWPMEKPILSDKDKKWKPFSFIPQ